MVSKRLSREAGHRRKFLTVIDETPECGRAVAYASRRAKNTGGVLVLLFVVDCSDFPNFLGVGDVMRAEVRERAEGVLSEIAARVREEQGIEAERIVREGTHLNEITKLIEEDQDIAVLVLAAGAAVEGPGPLVQSIVGRNSAFPVPVTVVPVALSDADIDAVA